MTYEGLKALDLFRYSIQSPAKVNWRGRKLTEEKFGFGSIFGPKPNVYPTQGSAPYRG